MARKKNEYTEETAENKQQKRVPDPNQGGKDDGKTPLVSGAVPPANDTAVKLQTPPNNTQTPVVDGNTQPPPQDQQKQVATNQGGEADPNVLAQYGQGGQGTPNPNSNVGQNNNIPNENQAVTTNVENVENVENAAKKSTQISTPVNQVVTQEKNQTGNKAATNTQQDVGNNIAQPYFKTDPAVQQEFANEVSSWGLNGNVDHMSRPVIDSQKMRAAHWDDFPEGDTATVYTSRYTLGEKVLDQNGNPVLGADGKEQIKDSHDFIMTPISANGKVYSPKALEDYTTYLITEAQGDINKAIELDRQKAGLIVAVDAPEGTEEKIHQAHMKYYAQGKPGEKEGENGKNTTGNPNANTSQGTQETDVVKNGTDGQKTTQNGGKNNDLSSSVKNTTAPKSVDDWKKNYSELDKDQLKSTLEKRKGAEGLDPNETKALEDLYAEKGGSLKDLSTESPAKEELTDEEKARKAQSLQDLRTQYEGSNKSLADGDLKVVSEAKMVEAGWVGASGKGNQIFYPQIVTITDGKGTKHKVLMSPIDSNGAIMTQDAFKKYVKDLEGSDDIMAEDAGGCGLIIRMDTSDGDLEALDKLAADILKGETPSQMTLAERQEAEKKDDPNVLRYKERIANAEEELAKARANLADPSKSPKNVFVEQANKALEDYDKETESYKKSQKRKKLIASIGDLLQSVLNSVGAWYGAKSADLTSLAAAAGATEEKELTRRDRRRQELVDSRDKAYNKSITSHEKDVEYWQKYLNELNEGLTKYNTDMSKLYKQASLRDESENRKTMEQGKRRVSEAKLKREEQKQKQKDALELEAFKIQGRKEVKAIPSRSEKTSTYHAYYDGAGGNGSKKKKSSNGRKKSKHWK